MVFPQLCPLSIHLITEIRMIKGHINYLQLFVLRMGGSIFEYSVFKLNNQFRNTYIFSLNIIMSY